VATSMLAKKFVEKSLGEKGKKMILIILDEMDQVEDPEVLYKVFNWISMDNSRLLLVGIANSLDLTDRVLPRLQVDKMLKPQLLNFRPYTTDQLVQIVEARLPQGDDKYALIDKMAIQLCARKIAATTGDARTTLDTCQRALQTQDGGEKKKVSLAQMSRMMAQSSAAQQSRVTSSRDDDALPVEQKLIICSLLSVVRKQKVKDVQAGKLYEVYTKQGSSRINQADFFSLCLQLEDRRIIDIKKNKQKSVDRQSKVKFSVTESDIIESYFKDDQHFETILTRNR